jgi:Restriction endonuclease PvuII
VPASVSCGPESEGGIDAVDPDGEEVEIKTTRLSQRGVMFPTSRYVSQTVIDPFRDASWWVFGVFNRYEELVALSRVESDAMKAIMMTLSSA